MAKKNKKKKKRLSKYEKTVIIEREAFRASKQPLVEKTHKEWKAAYLRYHELDLKRKDKSIISEERLEMSNLKMPPIGWVENNKIKLFKPKKVKATIMYDDGSEDEDIEIPMKTGDEN